MRKSVCALGTWPLPRAPYCVRLVPVPLGSVGTPFSPSLPEESGSYLSLHGKADDWHVPPCCGASFSFASRSLFSVPLVSLTSLEALSPELVSIYLPHTEVIWGQLTHASITHCKTELLYKVRQGNDQGRHVQTSRG